MIVAIVCVTTKNNLITLRTHINVVYCFLIKKELYMKHLLILLCICTLVSCGIKNKIWNSTRGQLGVSKQQIQHQPSVNTTLVSEPKIHQQTPQSHLISVNNLKPQKESPELKWYYSLPFVVLVILAILVYRLKQQNLKSL